ncbi:carbohydrate ABC transporter membrane protein 1 (CUT1 family) [Dongia mobilis]|uniref:Carbohydrate ABC transporter membrane protein 1 (CUT1 family) n=1 Tax=Dongia mobilis TaxID=578943 RepID=A0A4R6WEV7_9PROT|nr:sugar ABC transporter permease [Dongia mobilis]TDQ78415.1 carbohydrate ABC transporter membrane protein 1 (CUT1 family) [Dongia mobilis]
MTAHTGDKAQIRPQIRRRNKAAWYGAYFLLPALVYIFTIIIYPLFYSLYASFTDLRLTFPVTRFVGFDTYAQTLGNDVFHDSIIVTGIFLVTAIVVETILGFLLALSFSRMTGTHPVMRALIMLPLIATPVTVGLIWKLMLNSDFGIINQLTDSLGLARILWLADPKMALVSIVLMDVWQWTPFMFLIMLAGLEGLPRDVFEAAEVDGASALQILRRITVPLMKRIIAVAVVFRFMFAIATFDTVFVLTKGGPARATDIITLFIQREGLVNLNVASASAASFLLLIMVLVLTLILFKRGLADAR